jgi:Holliday junction resolvase RusA-like endonuclease
MTRPLRLTDADREAWAITFAPPADLISANDRLHWRKRAELTKAWRDAALVHALSKSVGPFDRAHITVAIRFATNHRRDVGNYYPTAKAIVDGLVDAGLLEDDDDTRIVGPDLRRHIPNGTPLVTITIQEIP